MHNPGYNNRESTSYSGAKLSSIVPPFSQDTSTYLLLEIIAEGTRF